MKTKHFFLALVAIAVATMTLSIFTCKADAVPTGPGGGDMKEHSQVVGCGSKLPIDWRPGCCLGTGGCMSACINPIQYCD